MEPERLNPQQQLDKILDTALVLFGEDAAESAKDIQEQIAARSRADLKIAKQVRQTFASKHGQATLEWLMKITVNAPHPSIEDLLAEPAGNRELMNGYRAGCNDMVFLIADAINQANAAEGDE